MNKIYKLFITLFVLVMFIPNVNALTKDETVYSKLNSDGSLFNTTVVNHLYDAHDDEIKDATELKEILNVNGKESFTINGNDLIWKNRGKEIFYQGKIEKKLPIDTTVRYFLDGKEIELSELVHKKGKVDIKIDFKNTDQHVTDVNGMSETIYTPFVVTVGCVFHNEYAGDISVTNGKVVNTGSKNFVVAIASPGLYDSLGIDEFKNMDSVTISFHTDNYQSNSIYVVATPKLIDNKDLDIFKKMDKIYDDVDKLQTNMNVIQNGAKELEVGAEKLANGSKEISNNLFNIVNYMKELENGSRELDDGLKQIISGLNDAKMKITSGDTSSSIQKLYELKDGNLSAINSMNQANASIKVLFSNYGLSIDSISLEEIKTNYPSLATYKQTYDGNLKLIYLFSQNNLAIDSTIQNTTDTLNSINNLLNVLDTSLNRIEGGANSIYNNIGKIRGGIELLYQGSNELSSGASILYNGTSSLSNGIATYNREGIHSLSSYANMLHGYTNKIQVLTNLCEQYKGFGSDNSNSTTFVSVIK